MKAVITTLPMEPQTTVREWAVDEIPVLTAAVTLPQSATTAGKVSRRIDRFYRLYRRAFLHYCARTLYPAAVEQHQHALAISAPLLNYTATLTYRITYNRDGILSLLTEQTETATAGRTQKICRGDTWDLSTGCPMPISAFFPPHTSYKKILSRHARAEIEHQEGEGVAQYHPGWQKILRRRYNSRNFFITDRGLTYFWQMYAIAPPAEGIPVFCMPFGTDNCRLPRKK